VSDYVTVTYPAGGQAERRFDRIIGSSAALESVLDQVEQVAPTDSTVLIEGETGTGKELIAHAIHNASQRYGRAFIKLNCAAIPLDLLESELFGHEKGAFTGAIAQKIGRFQMADKGTLFLDEVGDIPSALQPKLLRVLQEQEFERLGSGRTHKVDVRLVAATNQNLVTMVARGQFRSDLYYRLNVFPKGCSTSREILSAALCRVRQGSTRTSQPRISQDGRVLIRTWLELRRSLPVTAYRSRKAESPSQWSSGSRLRR
jgi:transcriptional regulator with GAF, ATPase, and Fis domain